MSFGGARGVVRRTVYTRNVTGPMTDENQAELVWADAPLTTNSNLFHIYEDGRSLCGKYALGSLMRTTPVEDGDSWRDGEDCKACCRKADVVKVDDE